MSETPEYSVPELITMPIEDLEKLNSLLSKIECYHGYNKDSQLTSVTARVSAIYRGRIAYSKAEAARVRVTTESNSNSSN